MTLVASIRSRLDARQIRERRASYARGVDPISAQLELLNASWERTAATVPFFRDRVERGELPRAFESLENFVECVPVTDRPVLQAHGSALTSNERPPERVRITGGSTAEPVQLPTWKDEFDFTRTDMWLGRSWYGISPESRLFLLWGHSHLLGSGWRGFANARRRELNDWLLGYRRFSAYDLRPESLRRGAESLIRFRPQYVIGYSVALDLFARANEARRDALRAAGVRAVFAAAEGFPALDSEARIADLFDCPVGMEYGAVETGLVAHTQPEGGYRVFWRTYLVDAERIGARHRVRVTSLFPRCLPLVRYELGDEIELPAGAPDRVASVLSFDRVIGRCNDYVVLDGGYTVHSEAFTHAVRGCGAVLAYQVVQEGEDLSLHYVAERELAPDDGRGIREGLGRVHAKLGTIRFVRVDALRRTIAGKTPMILRS